MFALSLLLLFSQPAFSDVAPLHTQAPAKSDDAANWAKKVQKAYEDAKSLSADVAQESVIKGKSSKGTSRIWIEKPGKLRWEIDTPEKSTMVSDGKTLWNFDPGENQVMELDASQTQSVTMLGFLGGMGKIEKDFAVSMIAAPANASTASAPFLKLVPKDSEDVQFTEIVMGLDKKSALAEEVFLTNALGAVTHMTFTKLQVNKPAPAKTFTFEIPKGAQVIKPPVVGGNKN